MDCYQESLSWRWCCSTKREGEKKSTDRKRFCERPAVDAEDNEYLLAGDFVKGAPARMDWKVIDVLPYISPK